MVTYNEHLDWLKRQVLGAEAEVQGFLSAAVTDRLLPFSKDPYLQQRFAQGYEDGRMKLLDERRGS
jgi:hypothetical protein